MFISKYKHTPSIMVTRKMPVWILSPHFYILHRNALRGGRGKVHGHKVERNPNPIYNKINIICKYALHLTEKMGNGGGSVRSHSERHGWWDIAMYFNRDSRYFGFENCRAKCATELEGFHPSWCIFTEPQSHASDFNILAVDCCHFLAGVVANPIHRGGKISGRNQWAGFVSETVSLVPGSVTLPGWC